jgi:class 3 adenylate cyclase/CHASE2 domain-containing sensor protein
MPIKKSPKELWDSYREVLGSRRRGIFLSCLAAFVVCVTLQSTGYIEALEDRIGRPALFYIRERLGFAPKLDPRLVIYAYNDEAVHEWGRPELLSGKLWGDIMGAITDHKPKAVLVDMIFGNKRKDPADIAAMNRAFKRSTPIYTAAVVMPRTLKNAKPLDLTQKEFGAQPQDLEFLKKYQGSNPTKTPYGPAENLKELHRRVGQINFRVPGFFMPVVTFPPDKMLKHLSLAHFDPSMVRVDGTDLYLNGRRIGLNRDGEALVNWSSKQDYFQNTFGITDLVETRRAGNFSNLITPESIVLFLPLMFTGNADFKQTYVGQLVGGYVHASIVNSMLTNDWIHAVDPSYLGVFLGLTIGFLGSLIWRNYMMISFLLAGNVVFFAACLGLFLTKGWLVEWLNCLLAFNVTMIPVIITSEVAEEIRSIRMNDALTGVLSPKMLEQISKAPEAFSLSAVEQTVTVMFVDFVGFSKVAERMPAQVVFGSLKNHFSDLGKIIHKYHGIVDKSLGDGLLGVFGFDPVTKEVSNSHAEDAVMAATEIQNLIADECAAYGRAADKSDLVIFASRIGLSTGSVFIGNIGEDGRLDLTVIGHTVNMGKRYEDACEPFKILLGQNTQQYLSGKLREKLVKRDIQIKHHAELIHALEHDPFQDNPKLYMDALNAFREFSQTSRNSERLVIPNGQRWDVHHDGVKVGHVVNYSDGGVCVDIKNYYGNKVTIKIDVFIRSADEGKILHELRDLHAVVKWGKKTGELYRHGLILSEESTAKFSSLRSALVTVV